MDAKSYIDSKVSDLHSQTLASVVEIVQKIPNLSYDDKIKLEAGLRSTSYGYRSQVDLFKENLEYLWSTYRVPTQTLEDCIGNYNSKKMEIMTRHFQSETFNIAAAEKNGTNYTPRPKPYFLDLEKPYCRIGNKFRAISLKTGNTVDECLLNPLDFQISDLGEYIIFNEHDKTLNILESTKLILEYGQSVGLGKDKVAGLLKSMIRAYSPQHAGIFSFIATPSDVFRAVISMVNYSTQMDSIKKAVSRINRQVGEPIETPIRKYMSLLLTATSLEQPNMSNEQAVDKATKKAIYAVNFLIEDSAKAQLQRMKQEEFVRLNIKTSLDDVLKFVCNIESDTRYALQSTKTLAGQPVNFSLYHTDTMKSVMVDRQQGCYDNAPELNDDVNHHIPAPGKSQHFYGGLHQHGMGPLRPMRALQSRQEYLPRHQDTMQHGDIHHYQRSHQLPHDLHHQPDVSHQLPYDSHHQPDVTHQLPYDPHHQPGVSHQHPHVEHHRHDVSPEQPQHNVSQHQPGYGGAQSQPDGNQHYYQEPSGQQLEDGGPPTPPDIQDASYGHIVPDIYYQHRNGDFTKLDLRSLWYKDENGTMCCLKEAYYQRRRSPSPDSDIPEETRPHKAHK